MGEAARVFLATHPRAGARISMAACLPSAVLAGSRPFCWWLHPRGIFPLLPVSLYLLSWRWLRPCGLSPFLRQFGIGSGALPCRWLYPRGIPPCLRQFGPVSMLCFVLCDHWPAWGFSLWSGRDDTLVIVVLGGTTPLEPDGASSYRWLSPVELWWRDIGFLDLGSGVWCNNCWVFFYSLEVGLNLWGPSFGRAVWICTLRFFLWRAVLAYLLGTDFT